jgi:hypothetical protein
MVVQAMIVYMHVDITVPSSVERGDPDDWVVDWVVDADD